MEILNKAQFMLIAGASGAYDPSCAGASARQSQHGKSSGSAGSNGSHDIYAGTDGCVTAIGLGAMSGFFGGPGAALPGVVTGGINSCIGSSNNGSGQASNGGSDCSGGIGGVCN
ncbi:hypothetical protein [Pantoea brenneri]|uniref:hypothetical protein n=1 Tax=Pantoea brenneri TaxID=472694 RepID=UPI0028A210C7|nr:hypothetical protein [Pantoea brenneri]